MSREISDIAEAVREALENNPTEDLASRIERELGGAESSRGRGRPWARAGTLRKMRRAEK